MADSDGQATRINLRCTECGYGVLVRTAPERCPMCGGADWEHTGADLLRHLLQARVRGEAADVRTLFRDLNEELAAVGGEELELVCECDDGRCFAAVGLSRDDFRALVATPDHRIVRPGHEAPGETVAARGPRFVVVGEALVLGRRGRGRMRR